MSSAVFLGFTAFLLWGLFPLYWKLLLEVPSLQILCHRVIWSCVWLALILQLRAQWGTLRSTLRLPGTLGILTVSSTVIAANWGIYIWAVNSGQLLEASLGYFTAPLVNVLFGVVFLRERLRPIQLTAVAIASLGVLWMVTKVGTMPWVALALAITMSLYALIRKRSDIEVVPGLFVEAMALLVPALLVIWLNEQNGTSPFLHRSTRLDILLVFSGAITILPLLLYTAALKRIALSTLGIMAYISPICQFLVAVVLFNEPFGNDQLITFIAVWTALALYTVDSWNQRRRVSSS